MKMQKQELIDAISRHRNRSKTRFWTINELESSIYLCVHNHPGMESKGVWIYNTRTREAEQIR
jgi:hypothetical protein